MRKFLLTWSALAIVFCAWAQERTVTGKVTSSEDGTPLPGVNVIVKGTITGTVTAIDGSYSIQVPGSGAALVFSFIGLKSQEVEVGDRASVDISLALDVTQLTEVVVTGVGVATERKKVALDVSSVSGKNLMPSAIASVDQAIQGKIAGAQIQINSGQPGAAANIQLRGLNGLGATNPLILVDGVQIGSSGSNALQGLDMTNIERIEVVKGAAGGMLYGAQGANGVIQIFTKRGAKDRRVSITANAKYIIDEAITGKEPLVAGMHHYDTDASGFILSTGGGVIKQDDVTRTWANPLVNLSPSLKNDKSFKEKTYDHLSQAYRQAKSYTASMNISGGTEKLDYSLNINKLKQENVRFGDLERYNIGLNLGAELLPGLNLRSTTQLIIQGENLLSGNRFALVNSYQWIDFNDTYSNGYKVIKPKDENELNPLSELDWRTRIAKENRIIQNFNLTYKFPKFVEIDYKYGVQLQNNNNSDVIRSQKGFLQPSDAFWGPAPGTGRVTLENSKSVYQNSLLSAYIKFDLKNDFDADFPLVSTTQVTYDWRSDSYDYYFGQASGFPYPPYNLSNGSTKNTGSSSSEFVTFGYLVNQTFDFGSIGGISGGFRSDYSSEFGFNKDGSSPESFFFPRGTVYFNPSELLDVQMLKAWKVRAAYGEAGIQPNNYARQPILGSDTYGTSQGLYTPSTAANAALLVQRNKEIEVGTDITLMPVFSSPWLNRIDIGFSFWTREGKDIIQPATLPPSSGTGAIVDNLISLSSKGIDFSLDFDTYKSQKFTWNLGLRLGTAKTTVDNLSKGLSVPYQYTGGTNPINVFIIEKGSPLGNFVGQVPLTSLDEKDASGAFYIDEADRGNYEVVSTEYGPIVVNKTTKEALVTSTDDKRNMGNAQPKFFGSIINDFTLFNLVQVNMQWDFSKGNKIYNVTRQWLYRDRISKDFDLPLTIAGEPGAYVTTYNSLYNSVQPSGWFVEDGSYMRLRNLSFSVDLKNVTKAKWAKQLSLTFAGRNLVTFTKYRGLDPESTSTGSQNSGAASLPVRGVDDFSFPNLKSYQFGITVGL